MILITSNHDSRQSELSAWFSIQVAQLVDFAAFAMFAEVRARWGVGSGYHKINKIKDKRYKSRVCVLSAVCRGRVSNVQMLMPIQKYRYYY